MKFLCVIMALTVVGCASQPTSTGFDKSDYDTMRPDCGQARNQAAYYESRIKEFHEYFRNRTPSVDDRKYYTRLKNNLWSLRSSCAVFQRGV